MSKSQEYNGWTNWETWNFMLWLNNDQILHKLVLNAYKGLNHLETKKKLLEEVAKKYVNTPLMADLKIKDVPSINFDELVESIEEEINNELN